MSSFPEVRITIMLLENPASECPEGRYLPEILLFLTSLTTNSFDRDKLTSAMFWAKITELKKVKK